MLYSCHNCFALFHITLIIEPPELSAAAILVQGAEMEGKPTASCKPTFMTISEETVMFNWFEIMQRVLFLSASLSHCLLCVHVCDLALSLVSVSVASFFGHHCGGELHLRRCDCRNSVASTSTFQGVKFEVKRVWVDCLLDNKTKWKDRGAKGSFSSRSWHKNPHFLFAEERNLTKRRIHSAEPGTATLQKHSCFSWTWKRSTWPNGKFLPS